MKRQLIDYREATKKGDAEAQYHLGMHYDNGEGVAIDYTQAAYWYRKAAEQGHTKAQYNLGACYYLGQGVAENKNYALYWLQKALEKSKDINTSPAESMKDVVKNLKEEGYTAIKPDLNNSVYAV